MDFNKKWFFDQQFDHHTKNLQMIRSQSSNRIDNSTPLTMQISKNRIKCKEFLKNEEYKKIFQKNQAILKSLDEISNRKVKTMQKKFSIEFFGGPKTLNMNYRKKQLEKIAYENDFIMKQITNKESSLSNKKLKEDYLQSLKYKKTLSKKNFYDYLAESNKNKPGKDRISNKQILKAIKSERILKIDETNENKEFDWKKIENTERQETEEKKEKKLPSLKNKKTNPISSVSETVNESAKVEKLQKPEKLEKKETSKKLQPIKKQQSISKQESIKTPKENKNSEEEKDKIIKENVEETNALLNYNKKTSDIKEIQIEDESVNEIESETKAQKEFDQEKEEIIDNKEESLEKEKESIHKIKETTENTEKKPDENDNQANESERLESDESKA